MSSGGEVQLGCDKCGKLSGVLIRCEKESHLICQSCWDKAKKTCPVCAGK